MNESQKYEIAVLAEDYEAKKLRFDCLAAVNTSGKSAEQLMKLSTDYHIADAERIEAYMRLEQKKANLVFET